MSYQVIVVKSAEKELVSLPKPIIDRIAAVLVSLAVEPRPLGVKKLKGSSNLWRIRIGFYRIIYRIEDDRLIVEVIRVRHRSEVYRGL